MEIRQIRNATLVIQYADKTLLVDPFLADKGAYPPFPNTPNQEQFNPIVQLPIPTEDIIHVDAVIVTHLHLDHFDAVAKAMLPKDIPIIAQSERDVEFIQKEGFQNVSAFDHAQQLGNIQLTRTNGKHGKGEIAQLMGEVSGVVLTHPDEQTLYIAGDTIWCNDVQEAIKTYRPEVIVVNGGAAQFLQGEPITMTSEDIHLTALQAPEATIIVTHMEALNHCLLSREELRHFIADQQLSSRIRVPDDGESLSFFKH